MLLSASVLRCALPSLDVVQVMTEEFCALVVDCMSMFVLILIGFINLIKDFNLLM